MSAAAKMAGFGVAAALIAMALRSARREMGAAVALAAGLMLFFSAVTGLNELSGVLRALSNQAGLPGGSMGVILKMLGVAYITEFSVMACKDAGEEGLSARVALCGKVMLLSLTLPILMEIAQLIFQVLP